MKASELPKLWWDLCQLIISKVEHLKIGELSKLWWQNAQPTPY